ncbi:pseudouridine synthase [Rhodoflexus sp.]
MNKKPTKLGKSGFGQAKGGRKSFRNSSSDNNRGNFNTKPSLRREGGNNDGGGSNNDRPPFRKRIDNDSKGSSNQHGGNKERGTYWWKDIPKGYERNNKSRRDENKVLRPRRAGTLRTPDYDLTKIKSIAESKGIRKNPNEGIRLNRFIANAGISSRREADKIIESGRVKINNQVVTEMGYRVKPSDRVELDGETLKRERLVYVLLNKPKDFITTTDDPRERKTVMELVKDACQERIYPVGRLDRNTTGLLLLTNDGALAEKLSHPSNQVKKNYQLELNKPLEEAHFDQIMKGFELEDGFIKPDNMSYMTDDRQIISIDIHSGRNRIIRRIFEHFGYEVVRLDRATYAGLTKKGLPRGHWRFLTQQEVIRLKFFTGKNKKTTSED